MMAKAKIMQLFYLFFLFAQAQGNGHGRELIRVSGGGSSGNKGSSSGSSSSGSVSGSRGYRGSCCVSRCCNSGFQSGHVMFWYGGYRASSSEGDEFLNDLTEARLALQSLSDTLKVGGNQLPVNDCAFILEHNQTVLEGTQANTTLQEYIDTLNNRLSTLQSSLEEEVDLERELNTWFMDFWRLDGACFLTLSVESPDYSSQILSAKDEVSDLEALKQDWDSAIESGAIIIGARFTGAALAAAFLGMTLL